MAGARDARARDASARGAGAREAGTHGAADPEGVVGELRHCRTPFLLGVRHHSPVLAAAVPALLDAAAPDVLAVELPAELERWVGWLADERTVAPVALSVAGADGAQLGFYPFADFSPELAAVRWAVRRGVRVAAVDLPAARRASIPDADPLVVPEGEGLSGALAASAGVAGAEELWDRLVEVRSIGAGAEAVRTAALAVGWAMRVDAGAGAGIDPFDLCRETWMRARLAELGAGGARVAAVVGSFHAAALLPEPRRWRAVEAADAGAEPGVSLVPYGFELLDSRSGYPAGIRDPVWQQRVWAAAGDPAAVEAAAAELVVDLCAHLRRRAQVASVPDAREAVRLALDLAALRDLPAPGRAELLEGLAGALGQGEPLGRGRALAAAAQAVLVGSRRGTVTPAAPRSGLSDHVADLLSELRLPGAADVDAVDLRLDPARSPLDRRRHAALARLRALGVVYATEQQVEGRAGAGAVTRRWRVRWEPATAASLELAAIHGATLEQAAVGALTTARRRLEDAGELDPPAALRLLSEAAACGLAELFVDGFARAASTVVPVAGLADLLALWELRWSVAGGHEPALGEVALPEEPSPSTLLAAAVAAAEGLAGSTDPADLRALGALVWRVADQQVAPAGLGVGRLVALLERFADDGSPAMAGAATGGLVGLGQLAAAECGARVASWTDAAALGERLGGFLVATEPLLAGSAALLDPLALRLEALDDRTFLDRLPALRHGFESLSPAARQRLLDTVSERLGHDAGDLARAATLDVAPEVLAWRVEADVVGRAAVAALLGPAAVEVASAVVAGEERSHDGGSPAASVGAVEASAAAPSAAAPSPPGGTRELGAIDRWRLVLGREREQLPARAAAMAVALDDLYGRGHGEGSAAPGGRGGGREQAFPTAREWADELEALFGADVREEVLARAGGAGRIDALLELDPDAAVPSVELLQSVLSLKGSLGEARLARLRPLVTRCADALTAELATRMRPALTGLATPRPTRRPVGPLDLRRTVAANLRTARREPDGTVRLVPDDLIFRTRARVAADWHLHVVVDVSGSMEPSTIYAALVAAIFSGVRALSVRFTAFSTEVVDLTDHVDDPLALLLEVSVGGGTDIGLGLRHARSHLVVPQRTIVVLVTDFEEGRSVGALLAEVRALAGEGVHLLGLAALDDTGAPAYHAGIAAQVVAAGMPVAALSPQELARWVGERIRGGGRA